MSLDFKLKTEFNIINLLPVNRQLNHKKCMHHSIINSRGKASIFVTFESIFFQFVLTEMLHYLYIYDLIVN